MERDLEEPPGVPPFLQGTAQQRLEVPLDGRQRRAQLVRDVGDELRAHALEPAERGDVVEHHDRAGLAGAEAQRHRIDLQHAGHRVAQAQLAAQGDLLAAGARRAEQLVQLGAADHLRQRLALAARRAHAEHRARALVHEHDALVRVHRDHALDHAVEDGGGLGALLLEVVDLLAQPGHHHVQRAAKGAELVDRAHRRAGVVLALAHSPRDLLHLDDGLGDPPRDEDADARRHRERQQAAGEHHPVQLGVGRRDHGQRQGQAQHADRAWSVAHGQRGIEQRRADRRACPQIPADAAGERPADLATVAVVLEARQLRHLDLGIAQHEAVERDQGHARAGGGGRAHGERPRGGRRRGPDQERARVVVQEPGGRGQSGLERVHGEGLEGVIQIDTGRDHAQRDEADERERELDGDAAADELEGPGHRGIIARSRTPAPLWLG